MSRPNEKVGLRVLVTSAYPDPEPITSFRRLIELDRFRIHTVTDDPDEADIILFVENSHYTDDPYFKTLRRHPWVKTYREKTFMYNEHDRPWCVLPGLYFSMPVRHLDRGRIRPCGYARALNPKIQYSAPESIEPSHLFSFVGSRTARIRTPILKFDHPRGYVRDTSGFNNYSIRTPADVRALFHDDFAQSLVDSKFILCPRGVATSSLRPFEAMKSGRVPVIVSDQYAFPEGPDWPAFSLHVPERLIDQVPELLIQNEERWTQMAQLARSEWEAWFAPDVLFHRMIDDLMKIKSSRGMPENFARLIPQPSYMERRARGLLHPARARFQDWRRQA